MRTRPVIEVVTVIAVTGLLLEVAKTYVWALVAAGVVAAVWLLARSHH
jgi:lipocalin